MSSVIVLKVPGMRNLAATEPGKAELAQIRKECKEQLPTSVRVLLIDKEIDVDQFEIRK
jgi:hypothetical protein